MSGAVHALFVSLNGAEIPDCLTGDDALAITWCRANVQAIYEFERSNPDVVILYADDDFQSLVQFFYSLRAVGEEWPTPVAMLVNFDHEALILPALEAGIDECVSSSLNPKEIVARIRALARRSKLVAISEKMHFADVVLDTVNLKAWRGGRVVPLSVLQFRLLKFFMTHPGRVFTRSQLLHRLWPNEIIDEGTVTQCVVRLRRALTSAGESDLIRSARGIGYALDEDVPQTPRAGIETILSCESNLTVTTRP